MARRRYETQPEALDIVTTVLERADFQLAAVAGAGIDLDLADRQAATEPAAPGPAEAGGQFRWAGYVYLAMASFGTLALLLSLLPTLSNAASDVVGAIAECAMQLP